MRFMTFHPDKEAKMAGGLTRRQKLMTSATTVVVTVGGSEATALAMHARHPH